MRRTLSAEELCADTGVSVERLDWLMRIGILKPREPGVFTAGDVFRVKLVAALLEAGFAPEQIEWGVAEGSLTFDQIDRSMLVELGPRSQRTFAEFSAEETPRTSLLPAVYKVLGLPEPDPSSRINVLEEALLEQFLRAWSLAGNDETVIRAARLIGEGTRLAAQGWMDLFSQEVAGPARERLVSGEIERFPQEIARNGSLLVRLVPRLVAWLTRRYLEQTATAGIVEGFEAVLAARGLAPAPSPAAPPALVFADLSGYTRLTEERGDEVAVRIAAALQARAETVATEGGGRLVKLLGDGAMLYFPDPRRGLLAAIDFVRTLGAELDLPARAGVHVGPVVERDRDLFGGTVNLASRIVEAAEPGEVIVSEAVVRSVGEGDVRFEPIRGKALKGFADPVPLFRATMYPSPQRQRSAK